MKFIDLFAGIGGFRRGMELAGHECVGFCEFDKYAVASYTAMHLLTDEQLERINNIPVQLKKNGDPNLRLRQNEIWKGEYKNGEWYANDIRSVDAGSMPYADCWCFGAPCQDFSIAGNRKGLRGDKSALVREVFKLLDQTKKENRPEWIIYENVKGMLSSNRGFDYLEIILAMDKLGYDCQWQVFNSKDWGVPQNRERVYTIGHLRDRGTRKILPICDSGEIYNGSGTNKREGKVMQIGNCMPTASRDNPNQGRIYDPRGIAPCLNKMDGGGRVPLISKPFTLTSRQAEINSKSHVSSMAIPVITPNRINKRQNGRRFKNDGDPMFTLTAQDRHGVMTDQMSIRQLTPKECFRLQGWTDDYFERAALVNSDSQLYRQAGNGVTVSVIYEIARRME